MILIVIILVLLLSLTQGQTFTVDLDLSPSERYTSLASQKKDSIIAFINYLRETSSTYAPAFQTVKKLYDTDPDELRSNVDEQFFEECQSISQAIGLPVSDIIVFNYMYELGAITDFCTAITVNSQNHIFLVRNLDYGYQSYLVNNSVHLQFTSQGRVLYETLGHAGFVGTHTAFKRATVEDPYQYALVFNERMIRGLNLSIQQMIASQCQTTAYTMMKNIRHSTGNLENILENLSNSNTCAASYFTILDKEGQGFVIEKNRGHTANLIRQAQNLEDVKYLVQTNHDQSDPDPDGRTTAATDKLKKVIESKYSVLPSDAWKILLENPNFNSLTLMSCIIDVKNGKVHHKIWTQEQ